MQMNRTYKNLSLFVIRKGISIIGTARSYCYTFQTKTLLLFAATLIGIFSGSMYGQALAANWYVRPSGGSGSGTSWTAAWNAFNGINWTSVQPGDTIWVAGGTYGSLAVGKSGTSGARIAIRRARTDSTECTGAAGWNAGYASTITQSSGSTISGNYSNITISGRTSANPPDWGSYGWVIDWAGRTSGDGAIMFGNGQSQANWTFEYMDLIGPSNNPATWEPDNDLSAVHIWTWNANASNHVFSHMKIHGWCTGIDARGGSNHLYEYIDMYGLDGDGDHHPNAFYIANSHNGTIRYSKFHDSNPYGTGIAFSDMDLGLTFNNWQIYGNVFARTNTGIAVQRGKIVGLKMWNNTFYSNSVGDFRLSSASCDGTSQFKNNLTYQSAGSGSCGSMSNNLTATSNPFVNAPGNDFHIVSTIGANYPRDKGTSLSAYFTKDMDGSTFGADGTWDIGAYEVISIPTIKVPNYPNSLQIN